MTRVGVFCFLICLFICCQPDLSPQEQEIANRERELELQPSPERANALLDELVNFVRDETQDPEKIELYLLKGLETAKSYELDPRLAGFLVPLIRSSEDKEERKKYLLDLGDLMNRIGKPHASSVIYKNLLDLYPGDPIVSEREGLIDSVARSVPDYMGYLYEKIIVDPDEYGINRLASIRFIDASEAYALSNPADSMTAEYLYDAAEVARSRRDLVKALSLYDWVIESYPNNTNVPNILFIKGFMMEQDFKDLDQARLIYEEFMSKYPDHQMASSVLFLLDNLGKSEEEILKVIEERRKQNSSN